MDVKQVFSNYLDKSGFKENSYIVPLKTIPELMVVIPCYKEGDITPALHSLYSSYLNCRINTSVLVVVNAPEKAPATDINKNKESINSIQAFMALCQQEDGFQLQYLVEEDIPMKIAGVGYARKLGFDTMISLAKNLEVDPILIWFDADSTCEQNFLQKVKHSFQVNKSWDAASIHFEHSIPNHEYEHALAIAEYELHLRVYIHFQIWSGLPFAFQTIGSSMAVKATSYAKNGGMSPKKAGEDFYFLQKMGDKGQVGQIRDTTVYPSCRVSDRVPFGTGKAIGDHLDKKKKICTYNPKSYQAIKPLWENISILYDRDWNDLMHELPPEVNRFCIEQDIENAVSQIKKNSSSLTSFQKRFYQWFNAFKFMKYLHFMRQFQGFEDCEVMVAFATLLDLKYPDIPKPSEPIQALEFLRKMDKQSS